MHLELICFPVLALVTLAVMRILRIRSAWCQAMLIAWLGVATAGPITRVRGGRQPPVPLVNGLSPLAMIVWAGVLELAARQHAASTRRGKDR